MEHTSYLLYCLQLIMSALATVAWGEQIIAILLSYVQ